MNFLERAIERLWQRLTQRHRTYGVSMDDTILLEAVPRKYPIVGNQYKTENGTKHFSVVAICKNDGTVTFRDDGSKEFYEVFIEVFELLFIPVDPKENYPL